MTIKIPTIAELKEKLSLPKPWDIVVIFLLNILITIPVFLIAHQNLIDLEWVIHLDRIILFIFIIKYHKHHLHKHDQCSLHRQFLYA